MAATVPVTAVTATATTQVRVMTPLPTAVTTAAAVITTTVPRPAQSIPQRLVRFLFILKKYLIGVTSTHASNY